MPAQKYYPFIFKALGKEQETRKEEVRKSTIAEEIKNSPKGKQCKIISQPDVSSTGYNTNVVLNSLLPKSLTINNFSIFKWILGKATPFPFPEEEKGKKETKYPFTN